MTTTGQVEKMYREWSRVFHALPDDHKESMEKLWGKPARLHRDLIPHLYQDEFFGWTLKHPLVFGIPYTAQDNRRLNEQLKWKKNCLVEHESKRKWVGWCMAHERPYRCDALTELSFTFDLSPEEFWTTARTVWVDSENTFQHDEEWRDLFTSWEGTGQEHFFGPDNQEEWDMFPDVPIAVYRGFCVDGREEGMSWTTDKIRAKFFANRFARETVRGEPRVAFGTVRKSDVIGYLNDRSESEVVIFPEKISNLSVLTVKEFEERGVGKDTGLVSVFEVQEIK